MIIHRCVQGTPEWLQLRCGIPTASLFDKIITPKTWKLSGQAKSYMYQLLAERIMQHPCTEFISLRMKHGSEAEAEAVRFYEFQRDCDTEVVGFISNDDRTIGASPDRLVGSDGVLEIKVPAEHTHIAYLIEQAVDSTYYPQIQGQLWIAEKKWVDILSYHPEMPPALIRVERDEEFIKLLSSAVSAFSRTLEGLAADLLARGWMGEPREQEAWPDVASLDPVKVFEELDRKGA